MGDKFKTSIVSIPDKMGVIVGAGFLVSEKYVLTCAHVVARALGIQKSLRDVPLDKVHLKFSFCDKAEESEQKAVTSRVVIWSPVSDSSAPGSDIALLALESEPPVGSKPCILIKSNNFSGHKFTAFGFPERHDQGVVATGIIRNTLANGWVQIEDTKSTGYFVEPGFSGAPVWDEQEKGVVGMVVASEEMSDIRAAFMIPAARLFKVCGELIPEENPGIRIMRKLCNYRATLAILLLLAFLLAGAYLGVFKIGGGRKNYGLNRADISGDWIYRSPPDSKECEKWHIKQKKNRLLIRTIIYGEKDREFSGDYAHETGRFSYSYEVPMTTEPAEKVSGTGEIDDTGTTITGTQECLGFSEDFILSQK